MYFKNDDDVCSMIWLVGFSDFDYGGYGLPYVQIDEDLTPALLKDFKKELRKLAKEYDENCLEDYDIESQYNQCIQRVAFVQAVTNNLQVSAEKHLEKLGFQKIGPFSKLKHPTTELTVWIMKATDFMKAIKYEGVK